MRVSFRMKEKNCRIVTLLLSNNSESLKTGNHDWKLCSRTSRQRQEVRAFYIENHPCNVYENIV